jgi:hypothetical protein
MPKRGERQPYKVRYSYPNGIKGVKPFSRPESAGYFGAEVLERGADIKIEFVALDGSRTVIVEREATGEAKAKHLDRVARISA